MGNLSTTFSTEAMSETKPTHLLIKTRPKGTQNPWSEAVVNLNLEDRYRTLASRNGWEIDVKPCIMVEKEVRGVKVKVPELVLTHEQRQREIAAALAEQKAAKDRVAELMKGLDTETDETDDETEELLNSKKEEKSFAEKMKEAKAKKAEEKKKSAKNKVQE